MKNFNKPIFSALILLVALVFGQNAMAQWTGAGTQQNPYQIKSIADMNTLATNVNSGTNYSGTYFLLTTDLTYTYTYAWNSTDYYASENNFTAIGAYGNSFKGHFDGGGHTISGIRIYKNGTTNADQLQGVFGNLSGGSVRNLTVADASITGYQQVGAIAGCNNGTIEDCVVASNVGIYRVADNASKHGGVVGANSNGNVRRCTSSATVKSHPKFANTISAICGGIIGYQSQSQAVNHYVEDNVALNVVVISGQSVGGAIIGHRTSDDNLNRLHLSRNYYRNCTINGSVNATNVGLGNPAGDMNGARSVHALTLGTDITATGESVVIGNTTYYASNTTVTLGHNNSTGYLVTYRLNGNALGGNTFTMPNNDNGTVSATLTPITYYVHFDKNNDGASGTMSDQQFTYGQAQNLTANAFSRTGYDFIGWSTTFNGEAEYTDGQSVSNLTAEDGQTVTLYAKWNISNYNITYDLDGGTVATENPTTYNIETPTFSLNNPTQAGCTFDGWTGTGLTEATQTVTIAQGSTGDRSYTANWTHFAYALVLHNDITATPVPAATYNNTSYYTPGTDITLSYNVTPSAGYEFQGFLVNGSPIEGNTFVMPASDVTVSANLAAIPWGGAGTSDSPYIIIHAAQLDMLATRLNTGTGDDYASSGYNGIYFKLGADINYNPNELINGENYTAIGNYDGNEDYQFNGTFDGDNHIISGIRINKSNYDLQGLFGEIASSGTVKNVILDDAVVIGRNCVGGIAGNKLGTIENCRVINTNITGNSLVGGIAGHSANQTIENNMVLNTAITCDDSELFVTGGAIIGSQQSGSIGYNYYHNCTLNGVASNIGCGVASIGNMIVGDLTSHNGAVQAYTLTLSPHITATPVPNATYDGVRYYIEGTEVTLGTNAPAYTITSATLTYGGNNYNIASVGGVYSFTMPAADATVLVTLELDPNAGQFTKNITGYGNDDNPGGWYLIASPVSDPITPTVEDGFLANTYDLYRFNQAGTDGEWENYKVHTEGFVLENGKGYLYANSENVPIAFVGTPYIGDGIVTLTKTTGVTLEGWNLVGNPFTANAYIDRSFYIMNDEGSEIIAATSVDRDYIKPMEGIFVHADEDGETMTFTTDEQYKGRGKNESLVINLSKGNRSIIDRAIVHFGSKRTMEKLQIFDGSTKLYIPQDFEEYAIVSSNRQGDIPLNFKAKETGMYTISFEGIDLKNIKLIDILEEKEIDLSENNTYTFIGSPADRQARFKIVFGSSTGSETENFAYQSGSDIIVSGEGELQIFDLMGRMVMQKYVNGIQTIEKPQTTGVYIFKLNGKAQKIIIK
ncbi:MAG: InlB B-repeat-containing protein [Bacteroidales bacterium]|nr:InlB B-repeat-containing protein [Bacteroidales bacterium]